MDTIRIIIDLSDNRSTNFLKSLEGRLADQTYSHKKTFSFTTGRLKNLRILATEKTLKIQGSWPNFLFGDNIRELEVTDIKKIITELSDFFGTDISSAKVTKLHYGKNIELPFCSNLIFKRLGNMPYMNRFEQKNSLYYQNNSRKLVIYDKTKESKQLSANGKNITRIELRYEKNLGYHFKSGLKISDLYSKDLLIKLQSDLVEMYNSIEKISQQAFLYPTIKPTELVNQLAALGTKMVGYQKISDQIKEWNEMRLIPYNKHYRNLDKLRELQTINMTIEADPIMSIINNRINYSKNSLQL